VSGVDGSGPVPTKGRIHPLYLVIFVAIVVVVLSFGLAGLRFLGGILLVASTGFLPTLVIWPSGLTLSIAPPEGVRSGATCDILHGLLAGEVQPAKCSHYCGNCRNAGDSALCDHEGGKGGQTAPRTA
jgi:hypothetical protein